MYNNYLSVATTPYNLFVDDDEYDLNKFDFKAYKDTDVVTPFNTLTYFMTNLTPEVELHKNLDFIKEVWKFKATGDIEQASLKDFFGDDKHGFYNPLFAIPNKVTGYLQVKKITQITKKEKN